MVSVLWAALAALCTGNQKAIWPKRSKKPLRLPAREKPAKVARAKLRNAKEAAPAKARARKYPPPSTRPPRELVCNATRSVTRNATAERVLQSDTSRGTRHDQLELAAAFDSATTVQCGLRRCAAKWHDAAGTRHTDRGQPTPRPPHAAEIEVRMGGGLAYVFMPKAGSKTIGLSLSASRKNMSDVAYEKFVNALRSESPPFVFTFVRSPAARFASGLGQAAMHFYGPAAECYAYGHRCMTGTSAFKLARNGHRRSEEVLRPHSPWGGGPSPERVSAWLAAVTYESGKPAPTKTTKGPFRNRHTNPMSRRLLLGDNATFSFVGRLEHLEADWAALSAAIVERGLAPLGPMVNSGKASREKGGANTTQETFSDVEAAAYALLEPPIPASVTDADIANICRMVAPDSDCLAGVYVPPTLCARPPTAADREPRGGSNRSLWNLWIRNRT